MHKYYDRSSPLFMTIVLDFHQSWCAHVYACPLHTPKILAHILDLIDAVAFENRLWQGHDNLAVDHTLESLIVGPWW